MGLFSIIFTNHSKPNLDLYGIKSDFCQVAGSLKSLSAVNLATEAPNFLFLFLLGQAFDSSFISLNFFHASSPKDVSIFSPSLDFKFLPSFQLVFNFQYSLKTHRDLLWGYLLWKLFPSQQLYPHLFLQFNCFHYFFYPFFVFMRQDDHQIRNPFTLYLRFKAFLLICFYLWYLGRHSIREVFPQNNTSREASVQELAHKGHIYSGIYQC